jgi:hypothetical protein
VSAERSVSLCQASLMSSMNSAASLQDYEENATSIKKDHIKNALSAADQIGSNIKCSK